MSNIIKGVPILHPRGKFETYEDEHEKFRWRIVSSNGTIIGASSQGFESKSYCIENAELVMQGIAEYTKSLGAVLEKSQRNKISNNPLVWLVKKPLLPKVKPSQEKPFNLFDNIHANGN